MPVSMCRGKARPAARVRGSRPKRERRPKTLAPQERGEDDGVSLLNPRFGRVGRRGCVGFGGGELADGQSRLVRLELLALGRLALEVVLLPALLDGRGVVRGQPVQEALAA